jgi:hypothetical protein
MFPVIHVRSAAVQVRVQEGSEQLRVVAAAEGCEQASSKLKEHRRVQEVSL